jgi:hypothetical protein
VAGGSEAHCRAIAERLAARHDVSVLTTTARDHVTWAEAYPAGVSADGRLRVHRFPVARPRSPHLHRHQRPATVEGASGNVLVQRLFHLWSVPRRRRTPTAGITVSRPP